MNTKLLKVANHIREKRAGIGGDIVRGLAPSLLSASAYNAMHNAQGSGAAPPYENALAIPFAMGQLHGMFSRVPSLSEIKEMDDHPNRAFIPGVTVSRLTRRRRALRRALRDNPELLNIPLSEIGGAIASIPINMGIGSVLGGGIAGATGVTVSDGLTRGGALGLATSLGGSAIASLLAAFTKRRTLEEQAEIENSTSRALLRHIIPGLGAYDYWKGLGATRHLSGDVVSIRQKIRDLREKRRIANEEKLFAEEARKAAIPDEPDY